MTAPGIAHRLRIALFDLDRSEGRLDVRGFAATTPEKRDRLDASGEAFVDGYRAAVGTGDPAAASRLCEEIPLPLRGFAYEGSAMGLSLLDLMTQQTPRRFSTFLAEYADPHAYMVHVGAGCAIARCPWGVATFLPRLDPTLRWLTVDGMGFHAGFFQPTALYARQRTPLLRRCEPDAFDAGLGRALWFVCGAQPPLAIRHIAAFTHARRPALWRGLGLAVTYAGGASDLDLRALAGAAGAYLPHVAVGAAFAAKARQRAGNPAENADRACRVFCGLSAVEAAELTDRCREQVATGHETFRHWRDLLLSAFACRAASDTSHAVPAE